MKKIAALGMVFLLVIAMVGCGAAKETISEKSKEEVTQGITITDHLGRTVVLPAKIDRVISSYYITTSLVLALDAKDKLVGIEMKPETREIYKKAAPELIELPQVGNSKTISVEECANLEAQVVIIPTKLKEFIDPLEKLGICVVAVEPENLEQFLECIQLVGTIVGQKARAQELTAYYEEKVDFVTSLTKSVDNKPSVLLFGTNMLSSCTPQMYQNSIIEMAGGTNVASDFTDKKWADISPEQIVSFHPDVMMNLSYSDFSIEEVKGEKAFADISAVKGNRLYTFPSLLEPWDYPTPSSILGILWLTNVLHPDLYDKESYIKDAQEFYKQFFGIEVTQAEIGV